MEKRSDGLSKKVVISPVDHATDSMAFVINESAAKFFGFKNTAGEELVWNGERYTIIGVIDNMVIQSPYQAIQPQLFHIERRGSGNLFILKLNPSQSSTESLAKIKEVFVKYDPSSPFEYQFVDQDYARKFENEIAHWKIGEFVCCVGHLHKLFGDFWIGKFCG
ncbi:MAG: ABC transporter permease [Cyclobacteriaceae bacterium]